MTSLTKVWESVKNMLDDGMSLIPVRDKNDDKYPAKTPYYKWAEFQERRATDSELWKAMEKRKTEAVAIVCGKISGNLEVIDVDSKNYEGISVRLFKEIKELRPDLYDKLRIHKTPSGGYHILYRIADRIPEGNQKLADRPTTEEEKEVQIKAGKKPSLKQNFLETRGEKGIILAPPSIGYSVHIDNPIPLISWLDRCELINICKSFNEVVVPAKVFKSTKKDDSIYTESPWEDFNQNGDIVPVLEDAGWSVLKHTDAERIFFTRPNSKSNGLHASFNTIQRYFWVFSTNTVFDDLKSYTPVDLLFMLKFNNDKSQTYRWLVDNGYGKVKKSVEKNYIKRQLQSGDSLPSNFSKESLKSFEDLKVKLTEAMPYGSFWNIDDKGKYIISREDLYNVSDSLGYKIYDGNTLVKIDGSIIIKKEEKEYFDEIKRYIWEEEAPLYTEICNSYEAFIQKSGAFTIMRLKDIDKSSVMKDGKDHSYKFYKNGFIKITKKGCEFNTYDNIEGLVWEHRVNDREWNDDAEKSNLFTDYLNNAIGISSYLKTIIGYLSHDFKQESSGYITVLTEKVPDPKDGGGSGKNIFGNMFKYTNTVKTVPGSQVKFDETFLQPWHDERVYFLADIPKKIDWMFMKEMATGVGMQKKLYKDQSEVQSEDMPKLLLNTNYSFDDSDGGLIRRIRHLEFEPYYTIHGGVDVVHGKMFPSDFNDKDWAGYDHFIKDCIIELFNNDGKIDQQDMSDIGWSKKFQMKYGESTYNFIQDNFDFWDKKGFVSNKEFSESYINYTNDLDIPSKYRLSSTNMNNALKDYYKKNKKDIDVHSVKKLNGLTTRGKKFSDNIDEDDQNPF